MTIEATRGQLTEVLKLITSKRFTKNMAKRILEDSPKLFRQEFCNELMSLARKEARSMEDNNEGHTFKILSLALIASTTNRKDDIEVANKAFFAEQENCVLSCSILLASIIRSKQYIDLMMKKATLTLLTNSNDKIKCFLCLTEITKDLRYLELVRRETRSFFIRDKEPDYYWVAESGLCVAQFTKKEEDFLFVRKCISEMKEDDYFLKSSMALSLFRITRADTDIDLAMWLISRMTNSEDKNKRLAELALLTKDYADIQIARNSIQSKGKLMSYIARATLKNSDINIAYRDVSYTGTGRLIMTNIDDIDADEYDLLLSAASEKGRFDIIEKLIQEASGYHKVRDCVRAFKKLTTSTN